MSKTNDTSQLATLEDHGTLADTQLDAVSGGIWFMGYSGGTDRPSVREITITKLMDAATPK